jgi:hypothetical protein
VIASSPPTCCRPVASLPSIACLLPERVMLSPNVALALLLPRQGVPAFRGVADRVANPGLEGGQVAALRLHARSISHVTLAAYGAGCPAVMRQVSQSRRDILSLAGLRGVSAPRSSRSGRHSSAKGMPGKTGTNRHWTRRTAQSTKRPVWLQQSVAETGRNSRRPRGRETYASVRSYAAGVATGDELK